MALGDWENIIGNFTGGPDSSLCYIFFVLATFITQITMFNMLIAIMGDTFDKVTEHRDVNATKSKLELMADLVAILEQEEKEDYKEIFFFTVQPEADDVED